MCFVYYRDIIADAASIFLILYHCLDGLDACAYIWLLLCLHAFLFHIDHYIFSLQGSLCKLEPAWIFWDHFFFKLIFENFLFTPTPSPNSSKIHPYISPTPYFMSFKKKINPSNLICAAHVLLCVRLSTRACLIY